MFRFALPLAYLRSSPRATRLVRRAIGLVFQALDAGNDWRDRYYPERVVVGVACPRPCHADTNESALTRCRRHPACPVRDEPLPTRSAS